MTVPTSGPGLTWPTPRAANSSARCIIRRSICELSAMFELLIAAERRDVYSTGSHKCNCAPKERKKNRNGLNYKHLVPIGTKNIESETGPLQTPDSKTPDFKALIKETVHVLLRIKDNQVID